MDQALLSWIYYIVFTVYASLSSFMALRRPHSAKANLLTLIFAAAGLWALCLAFATISPDIGTSLLWRRLGVLGWGTIFSFILHITLITTGRGKLLARQWIYAFLYLPAITNIVLFLLAGDRANSNFNLQFFRYGWMNTWVSTFANWFHAVYYVLFIGLSILLFLLWLFKAKSTSEKRQARWFVLSLFAAAFAGSLTDFINVRTYQTGPPQLGIVFVLFPAMVLFYLISRYDFLGTDTSGPQTDSGMFSVDLVKSQLFERAAYLVIFAAFFNLANRVLVMRDFTPLGFWLWGLLLSLILMMGGTAVIHARRLGISGQARKIILRATVLAGLASGIYILAAGGSASLWGLLFLIFIAGTVFGNPVLLVIGVLTQIGIQFYLMFASGPMPGAEHLMQYVMPVMAIGAGVYFISYVNRTYQARLRENRERSLMQNAVLDLSRDLQARSGIPADDALADAADIIAGYLGCHRAAILLFQDGRIISTSFSRTAGEKAEGPLRDRLRAAYGQLLSGDAFSQPGQVFHLDLQQAGEETPGGSMRRQGIRMVAFSPFLIKDAAMGILLAEMKDSQRAQEKSFQDFLLAAAGDLSRFLLRALKEQELIDLAFKDPLTGFLRREQCIARIQERIARHQQNELIAVMFIDVDNFKAINDTAGHQVGDQVLAIIGKRFSLVTRPDDVLGRFGGDEFLCLSTQTSLEVVEDIADRLVGTFSQPISVGSAAYLLSASIGIAVYPRDGRDAQTLLKKADVALYHRKANRKGNYQFYHPLLEDAAFFGPISQ